MVYRVGSCCRILSQVNFIKKDRAGERESYKRERERERGRGTE